MDRLVLLHLSDLHFGQHSRFPLEEAEGVGDLLADAVAKERKALGWGPVDLVVVTGDIAEMGLPKEFEGSGKFLARVSGGLGVERRRFAFVPGNHDVSWTSCRKAETALQDQAEEDGREVSEKELRAALDQAKLERYDRFVAEHYGAPISTVARPLGHGAFFYLYGELGLSVGALNSCEKESHRPGDHVGQVSRDQAEWLMKAWKDGESAAWLKILAVHHNPVVTTPNNVDWWQGELEKRESCRRSLSRATGWGRAITRKRPIKARSSSRESSSPVTSLSPSVGPPARGKQPGSAGRSGVFWRRKRPCRYSSSCGRS